MTIATGCLIATSLVGSEVTAQARPAPVPQASPEQGSAGTAAKTVRIRPGVLDKGAPTAHPRLAGTTIRDGRFRKDVRVLEPYGGGSMYDTAHKGYVVGAYDQDRKQRRIWYVPRKGKARPLRLGRDAPYQPSPTYRVSPSGRYATVINSGPRPDRVQIRTIPGDRTIARARGPHLEVLDMRGSHALLNVGERVTWLDPTSDKLRRVVRSYGYFASVRHNLLLIDEPYRGAARRKGGYELVRLDRPREVLWRRVRMETSETISPNGRYLQSTLWRWKDGMETKPVGIEIRRTSDGKVIRRFRAREVGYRFAWVGKRRFVVAAEGRDTTALIRCEATGGCVRVGKIVRTEPGVWPDDALGVSLAGS